MQDSGGNCKEAGKDILLWPMAGLDCGLLVLLGVKPMLLFPGLVHTSFTAECGKTPAIGQRPCRVSKRRDLSQLPECERRVPAW